jgi:uncharacterized membrane protein YoaK (UPF0700 family)
MLVSHAHSFRQQARLAITLAWVAGYTNIITLLACGIVTSHVSGTTSNFGKDLFSGSWASAGFAAFLLTCFFCGAGISGFSTELGRRRGWESIFVLPMVIEAAFLATFAILLLLSGPPGGERTPREFILVGLAAAAMGLQNATITQISRGQVRTTHVTGVLTDLGQEFVQYCWWLLDRPRNHIHDKSSGNGNHGTDHATGRRLLLLAAIFFFFATGAGLGTLMYTWRAPAAMFVPVLFLIWIVYQDITTPIAEIEASRIEAFGADFPSALSVFKLRRDSNCKSSVLRIPNLLAWSDRLPAATRVAILDVGEFPDFNTNALLELRLLLERFEVTGRILIIAGLSSRYTTKLLQDKAHDWLLDHLCPDLDLAIARGLNRLDALDIAKKNVG